MNEWTVSAAVVVAVGAGVLAWRAWRGSRGAQLRRITRGLGLARDRDRSALATAPPLDRPPFGDAHVQIVGAWRGELLGAQLWALELQRSGAAPDPVVVLRGGEPLPALELLPRSATGGETGIAFPGHERFTELFLLRGDDEPAIRRVFRDEVVGFFERAENLSWVLVAAGGWLAISVAPMGERRRRLDPKHFAGFVEDAKVVYRVLQGAPPRPRIGKREAAAAGAPVPSGTS
jgi:hypothetical protein